MAAESGPWHSLALDSSLHKHPRSLTPAPVVGKLDLLPFDQLPWEDFERIQWRVLRDVEGLRHAQVYGDRGQKQYGLDVVALAPDNIGVALQSKRYSRFGPAELKAAVNKFRTTVRPFSVERLIIGVSREVKSTGVIDALAALRKELHPLVLDFWDKQELSRLLRNAPEIVIEFFGQQTAEAFCLPFTLEPVRVPSRDAVAVRDALARTPEEATGAGVLFREADTSVKDPTRALALVEEGQARLRDAGFAAHAAQHEAKRSRLLASLGRTDEAGRQILDELWTALDQGLSTTAEIGARRIQEISIAAGGGKISEFAKVAETAIALYLNPLGYVPSPTSLTLGDPIDQVRLAVLAGETALANDDRIWLASAEAVFSSLAGSSDAEPVHRTRLRLLHAESTGDWTALLEDARKLRLGHDLLGLVTARFARHRALNQSFPEADALWDEAAGDACLAQRWIDASRWVLSRRAFRGRWRPFTSDELLPLQTALREMGPSEPIVTVATASYEDALEGLRTQHLRAAAISAQRALRDAVVTSDWAEEARARRVLAAVLAASDEPDLAAHHLTRSGDASGIKELGKSHPGHFIDVTDDLTAPNYWTVGTAYRLVAEQADLVPDATLSPLVGHIVDELSGAETGTLTDLRAFATSRYLGAVGALAGIAHRLHEQQAETVLAHFERQPPIDADHYRRHDEDEATLVARIALHNQPLRRRALSHLVALLARSQSARNGTTGQTIDKHFDIAREDLATQAEGGNSWAQETLSAHNPENTKPDLAEAALARLTTPLEHEPGVYSDGTGAVGDSLLAYGIPPDQLDIAVAELLNRADDPHVGTGDRGDYLIAASNLAGKLSDIDRQKHFTTAMRLISAPAASEHDEFEAQFSHKLGGIQIAPPRNESRGHALFAAACLATDDDQRAQVKNHAYSLMGTGDGSDYWLTRALQKLGDALNQDLGYLVGQGWAVRCLVGMLWAEHATPAYVGTRLARDDDTRVRRALARALSNSDSKSVHAAVREQLAQDPAYSVREALRGGESIW